MKQRKMRYTAIRQPIYPNAADESYFAEKASEILAAVITGTGALTVMLFLITFV